MILVKVCTLLSVSHTFYEAAYNFVDRPEVMSIDEFGISRHLREPHAGDNDTCSWKCSSNCKPLTDNMVSIISDFKSGFNAEMKEVRKLSMLAPITLLYYMFFCVCTYC